MNKFLIKRLRNSPVDYQVHISHIVVEGRHVMRAQVVGLREDSENSKRVASDLRFAADMLETR